MPLCSPALGPGTQYFWMLFYMDSASSLRRYLDLGLSNRTHGWLKTSSHAWFIHTLLLVWALLVVQCVMSGYTLRCWTQEAELLFKRREDSKDSLGILTHPTLVVSQDKASDDTAGVFLKQQGSTQLEFGEWQDCHFAVAETTGVIDTRSRCRLTMPLHYALWRASTFFS